MEEHNQNHEYKKVIRNYKGKIDKLERGIEVRNELINELRYASPKLKRENDRCCFI